MIIAIDGPAASGKGTLAKRVADHFGFHHLDTGLLYRAVARDVRALRARSTVLKMRRMRRASSIRRRSMIRRCAIRVSATRRPLLRKFPRCDRFCSNFRSDFAQQPPGAVLDGRDIGTVICPDADVKIFVTLQIHDVRAERRFQELVKRGEAVSREDIFETITLRDKRDSERADSPMLAAEDALLLDTTKLGIDETFDAAIELIKRKIGQPGASHS